MKALNLLAMDFGASNGRGLLGAFDGERLVMKELHRFPNEYLSVNGLLYWDSLHMYRQILTSIEKYIGGYGTHLDGLGIDTWGVDYGLIDKNGQICGAPLSYRDSTDATMDSLWDTVISRRELFNRTGIAANNFNTIYQLYARKLRSDPALETAESLLMLPDLFSYILSGEKGNEYTMSFTSQLCNPNTGNWDYELIEKLGLPSDIFVPVTPSSTIRGHFLLELANQYGTNQFPIIAVGGHDTASAVAAVPGKGDFAFLSSGTWSLMGMESEKAIINDAVYEANYSNEGAMQGGFRPLVNISGLWIIQQIRLSWLRQGKDFSWDEIVAQARETKPFQSIINPDDSSFFLTDDMIESVQNYCKKTNQKIPETVGELARCAYDSLALKYRWALENMETIRGKKMDTLHIVGGGCQNKLLNQITADAIQRPVIAGPIEGASIGNLLSQAIALGEISGITQLRDVVRNSFDLEEYLPNQKDASLWDDTYDRFLQLLKI